MMSGREKCKRLYFIEYTSFLQNNYNNNHFPSPCGNTDQLSNAYTINMLISIRENWYCL